MFLLLAFEAVAFGDAKHAVPGRLNSQQGLHSSLFRGKACGSYGFYSGAIVADSVVAEMYFFLVRVYVERGALDNSTAKEQFFSLWVRED